MQNFNDRQTTIESAKNILITLKVRIWETDQDMTTANDTIIQVGNKLESIIETLTPGKSYKMRVLAFSNGGDGRMSSPPLQFQMGKTKADYENVY